MEKSELLQPGRKTLLMSYVIPLFTAALGGMVCLLPVADAETLTRAGFFLVITAILEMLHGFRRVTYQEQKSAWAGAAVSLAMGGLLVSSPLLASRALQIFLAVWSGMDGLRQLAAAGSARDLRVSRISHLVFGVTYTAFAVTVLLLKPQWLTLAVTLAAAFRIAGTAWTMSQASILTAELLQDPRLLAPGLPSHPAVDEITRRVFLEETARASADRDWIISFLLTLLAIHIGRMGFDRSFLGLMSPVFAVLGDVFAALLIAFLIVIPVMVANSRMTQAIEGRAWLWCVSPARGAAARFLGMLLQLVLLFRLRQLIRLRRARCSLRAAISRGLQIGLPPAAFIAATVPMWGMSWYFDTENWAAGIWNSWAEHRTDTWRTAMVRAVDTLQSEDDPGKKFSVLPDGLQVGSDFSFLVIGDPGEGDGSQQSLKSQILEVARRENVRFVVISSDVVYPTGAMRDYEAKFWLPFMGTQKPVYAIPGNHDWYDALEGFSATFLTPESARAAMRARVEADNRITSTTESRIEALIAEASRLRQEYQVPTQQQDAPYFQFQTPTFALFAVDTGVARGIDSDQRQWLESALQAANGKTRMVILGHPFLAGGIDQSAGSEELLELRNLLRKYDVSIVMAGDTHDLEYYREVSGDTANRGAPSEEQSAVVHHFVNGGGGAYLSFGTALDWPQNPALPDWAFFPNTQQVVSRIEATVPFWKRPAWIWTRRLGGWPFSAEWLSAAFDSNQAPFYQSFVEVRVEVSRNRVLIIPYGVHGQLRYGDLERSGSMQQSSIEDDVGVEWVVPMLQK